LADGAVDFRFKDGLEVDSALSFACSFFQFEDSSAMIYDMRVIYFGVLATLLSLRRRCWDLPKLQGLGAKYFRRKHCAKDANQVWPSD
jgi:hypothetical protein